MLVLSPTYPDSALAQALGKTARKVLTQVTPDYPDFFRNGHFQGRIVAEATVLPNGNVSNVDIKAGNPMFASFAAKALMKWKYAPGPDKTVEEVVFNFNSTQH
jgi:outer membrane biosynthesis protein TonB